MFHQVAAYRPGRRAANQQCVGVLTKPISLLSLGEGMAYKRSNGKLARRKKMEPAVTTLFFNTPVVSGNSSGASYIDLSQVASLVNRRFYRQGINWVVGSMKVFTSIPGTVTVLKLPQTWVMKNSWVKGFNAWKDMNEDALEDNESVRPKFLDFKIYADADHHSAGYAANLLPRTFELAAGAVSPVEALPGEWEPSKYVIPRGTTGSQGETITREVIATGPNYPGVGAGGFNAVSLIEGYAASRGLPHIIDPNTPGDAADAVGTTPQNWITALSNDGVEQDAEVLGDMISENNQAPYPFEDDGSNVDTMYPGGANQLTGLQIHDTSIISATTIGSTTHLKGGEFYCGLMKILHTVSGETAGNLGIQIDLVPGPHRGYMCESMGA